MIIICLESSTSFADYIFICAAKLLGIRVIINEKNQYGVSLEKPTSQLLDYNEGKYIENKNEKHKSILEDICRELLKTTQKSIIYSNSNVANYTSKYEENKREIRQLLKTENKINSKILGYISESVEVKRRLNEKNLRKLPVSYILLMLAGEPEATISPSAIEYPYQLDFARDVMNLAKQLGMPVIVREHPTMYNLTYGDIFANLDLAQRTFTSYRSDSFYEALESHPSFIGYENNQPFNHHLANKGCNTIATVSPTGCIQGILNNKKLIITCGPKWFEEYKSVVTLKGEIGNSTINECKRRHDLDRESILDKEELRRLIVKYFHALEHKEDTFGFTINSLIERMMEVIDENNE